jgi:DNA-directed RNA polymerase subunit alpha
MTAHLEQIIEVSSNAATMQVISNGIDANENIESSNSFATPISELDLSVRSFNSLRRQGIQTIQELTEMTKSQIEGIKNLGKKSLREIIKKITERGFVIKEDTTN